MLTWIAGLGLGLKIALGATIAAAAVTGAGAAGVLPFGAQDTFNEVVSVVIPAETEEGTEDESDVTEGYDPEAGNFGSWVSEQAKNKPGTGQEFGQWISDEAKNKPHGAPTGDDGEDVGDDSGDAGDTTGDAVNEDGSQDDGQRGVGGGSQKDSHN